MDANHQKKNVKSKEDYVFLNNTIKKRWLRGLKHWFAKSKYYTNNTVGSNPILFIYIDINYVSYIN